MPAIAAMRAQAGGRRARTAPLDRSGPPDKLDGGRDGGGRRPAGALSEGTILVSFAWSRKAALAVLALVASGPAYAELGGPLSTVQTDGRRMAARMVSSEMGSYALHTLTRANGGIVRELTNADGQVFAVTWSGPGKPDLRSLLGPYFQTFQAAGAASGRGLRSPLRRPPQVNRPDLQIETAGHMGWFRGIAFIPSLAPPGFSAGDLPQEP